MIHLQSVKNLGMTFWEENYYPEEYKRGKSKMASVAVEWVPQDEMIQLD
jgi:hypothetical protein